jgi:hypothetical protein
MSLIPLSFFIGVAIQFGLATPPTPGMKTRMMKRDEEGRQNQQNQGRGESGGNLMVGIGSHLGREVLCSLLPRMLVCSLGLPVFVSLSGGVWEVPWWWSSPSLPVPISSWVLFSFWVGFYLWVCTRLLSSTSFTLLSTICCVARRQRYHHHQQEFLQ